MPCWVSYITEMCYYWDGQKIGQEPDTFNLFFFLSFFFVVVQSQMQCILGPIPFSCGVCFPSPHVPTAFPLLFVKHLPRSGSQDKDGLQSAARKQQPILEDDREDDHELSGAKPSVRARKHPHRYHIYVSCTQINLVNHDVDADNDDNNNNIYIYLLFFFFYISAYQYQ